MNSQVNIDFENTEIAFGAKSNGEIKRAAFLFKMIAKPSVVVFGKRLSNFAIKSGLPVSWIIKPTIFKQFCGGVSIEDCSGQMASLDKYGIQSILDYSAEGLQNEKSFDDVLHQVLETIRLASTDKRIPFAVFKPTGIGRLELYEKVSNGSPLSESEKQEYDTVVSRYESIFKAAYESGIAVMVDAEETWIQQPIDDLIKKYSLIYNKEKAIIWNTLQMYRKDRLAKLKEDLIWAKKHEVFLGYKIVRGAYMEKERERAAAMKYESPIQETKADTDEAFNSAISFTFEHRDHISICNASHNEESNLLLVNLMNDMDIKENDSRFWFAQLFGMSDHISFNLAHGAYNVAKYLPFGPVRKVLPYLIRRAEENTSVAGQTGRELSLIRKELERRQTS